MLCRLIEQLVRGNERPGEDAHESSRLRHRKRLQVMKEVLVDTGQKVGRGSRGGVGSGATRSRDDHAEAAALEALLLSPQALRDERLGETSALSIGPVEIIEQEDERIAALREESFGRAAGSLLGRAAVLDLDRLEPAVSWRSPARALCPECRQQACWWSSRVSLTQCTPPWKHSKRLLITTPMYQRRNASNSASASTWVTW